jgi:YHS domain-containing protein
VATCSILWLTDGTRIGGPPFENYRSPYGRQARRASVVAADLGRVEQRLSYTLSSFDGTDGIGRARMAKDPVCGMDVDESNAPATSEHEGRTYHFCAQGCKREFDANPEKYATTES